VGGRILQTNGQYWNIFTKRLETVLLLINEGGVIYPLAFAVPFESGHAGFAPFATAAIEIMMAFLQQKNIYFLQL